MIAHEATLLRVRVASLNTRHETIIALAQKCLIGCLCLSKHACAVVADIDVLSGAFENLTDVACLSGLRR